MERDKKCNTMKDVIIENDYFLQYYDMKYIDFLPEFLKSTIIQNIIISIMVSEFQDNKNNLFPKTEVFGIEEDNKSIKLNSEILYQKSQIEIDLENSKQIGVPKELFDKYQEFLKNPQNIFSNFENIKRFNKILIKQKKMEGNLKNLIDKLLFQNKYSEIINIFKELSYFFHKAEINNFYHGDPKPENIVYKSEKPFYDKEKNIKWVENSYRFFFIDYEYSIFFNSSAPYQKHIITNNIEFIRENYKQKYDKYSKIKLSPENFFGHYNIDIFKGMRSAVKYEMNIKYYIDFPILIGYFLLYYSSNFLKIPALLSCMNTYYEKYSKYFDKKEKVPSPLFISDNL